MYNNIKDNNIGVTKRLEEMKTSFKRQSAANDDRMINLIAALQASIDEQKAEMGD